MNRGELGNVCGWCGDSSPREMVLLRGVRTCKECHLARSEAVEMVTDAEADMQRSESIYNGASMPDGWGDVA